MGDFLSTTLGLAFGILVLIWILLFIAIPFMIYGLQKRAAEISATASRILVELVDLNRKHG